MRRLLPYRTQHFTVPVVRVRDLASWKVGCAVDTRHIPTTYGKFEILPCVHTFYYAAEGTVIYAVDRCHITMELDTE